MIIFYLTMIEKKGSFIKYRIVIILFLLVFNYFNKNNSNFVGNFNYEKEFNKIEEYLKFCNNELIKLKKIKKYKNPKISIVSTIYNRGKYIQRFIKSIQNQNFKEVEIILVDDYSHDNSNHLIKNVMQYDNRILLIQNKKNKGTFASRNIGALKTKGQFVMFPDPDDILEQNCLKFFYNLAKKYDFELIRFHIYLGKGEIYYGKHINSLPSKPIYQPQLSTYIFYATKFHFQTDFNVSNKFIKREALIRTLNYISKDMFLYMNIFEDGILNYFFYRNSKSFFFSKKVAYYYIINNDSITTKIINYSLYLKCLFFHLKFVFEYSKNTKYEKNMSNILIRRIVIRKHINKKVLLINNDFTFYIHIIDEFLENEFISNKNKNYLMKTRKNILNAQKKVISSNQSDH